MPGSRRLPAGVEPAVSTYPQLLVVLTCTLLSSDRAESELRVELTDPGHGTQSVVLARRGARDRQTKAERRLAPDRLRAQLAELEPETRGLASRLLLGLVQAARALCPESEALADPRGRAFVRVTASGPAGRPDEPFLPEHLAVSAWPFFGADSLRDGTGELANALRRAWGDLDWHEAGAAEHPVRQAWQAAVDDQREPLARLARLWLAQDGSRPRAVELSGRAWSAHFSAWAERPATDLGEERAAALERQAARERHRPYSRSFIGSAPAPYAGIRRRKRSR